MSDSWTLPLAWCAGQVLLLSTFALVVSRTMIRRYPQAASTVLGGAAIAILAITVLMPLPHFHSFEQPLVRSNEAPSATPEHSAGIAPTADRAIGEPSVFVEFNSALELFMQKAASTTKRADQSRFMGWAEVFAGGLVVLGLLGLGKAWRDVRRLRRESVPIDDRQAHCTLTGLAAKLSLNRSVSLAASTEINSAAVVGWRRPVILLADDWQAWSADELRAAVAHELAHVVRSDYLWRLATCLAQAIHFYHPLTHLLIRQLTAAQELAADQLAVQVLSDQKNYLLALSRLALRQDGFFGRQAAPIVLPTLSTHLIRRIEMLSAKDCSQFNRRTWMLPVTLAGLAAVTLVTTALRGMAEPPAATRMTNEQVVTQPGELFHREPISVPMIDENPPGLFVVRVGELARRAEFAPFFRMANDQLSQFFHYDSATDDDSPFDLAALEYIASSRLELKCATMEEPGPSGEQNRFMIGASEAVFRFQNEVAWQEWIRTHLPEATEHQDGELVYFEYSSPAMGPQPVILSARDERTVVIAMSLPRLHKLIDSDTPTTESSALATEWDAVDGGLLTLVAQVAGISALDSSDNRPGSREAMQLLTNVRKYALGCDLTTGSSTLLLHCQMTCRDRQAAELVKQSITQLQSMALTYLATLHLAEVSTGSELAETEQALRFPTQLFQSATTELTTRDDGTTIVELKTSASLPVEVIELACAAEADSMSTK